MSKKTEHPNAPSDAAPAAEEQKKTPAEPKRMHVRINGRFLLALVLVFAAAGGATHLLHSMQMTRNANSLKTLAEEARESGDWKKEADFLSQYLRFRPDDYDAKIALADALENSPKDVRSLSRILRLLEDVLRNEPERDDVAKLRERAITLSIGLRRYSDAMLHLKNLKTEDPDFDPAELAFLEGTCEQGTGAYQAATLKYLQAIQHSESTVGYYVRLADLLLSRPESIPEQRAIQKAVPNLDVEFREWFPKRLTDKKKKPDNAVAGTAPKTTEEPREISATDIVEKIYTRLAGTRGSNNDAYVAGKGKPWHIALLARSQFLMNRNGANDLTLAAADARKALDLEPKDADALSQAAEVELARAGRLFIEPVKKADFPLAVTQLKKHLDTAEGFAKRGEKLPAPDALRFYATLARIDRQRAGNAKKDEPVDFKKRARSHVDKGLSKLTDYLQKDKGVERTPQESRMLRTQRIKLQLLLVEILLGETEKPDGELNTEAFKKYQTELVKLEQLDPTNRSLGVFGAQTLMSQQNWRAAIEVLTRSRRSLLGERVWRRRMDFALAECRKQLNDTTGRIHALRQGLADDSTWHRGRLVLASILADLRQFTEATSHYRILVAQGINEAILPFIRMQVRQQASASPRQRNLNPARKNLSQAKKLKLDEVTIALIEAEIINLDHSLTEQVRYDRMQKLLDGMLKDNTQNSDLLAARARIELFRPGRNAAGRARAAIMLLKGAETKAQSPLVIVLSRAEIAARLPKEEAKPILDATYQRLNSFSDSERTQLLQTLAESYVLAGMPDESLNCRMQIAKKSPNNLQAQLAVALRLANDGDPAEQLEAIRKIEGPGGAWGNYVEAIAIVAKAIKTHRANLDALKNATPANRELGARQSRLDLRDDFEQVHRLLSHSARLQPQRHEIWHQLGRVCSELKLDREAAENFERAIDLGDRSSEAFSYVYQYKSRQNDLEGAGEILKRVERTAGHLFQQGGDLTKHRISYALQRREYDQLTQMISPDSKNYYNSLFLGIVTYSRYLALPESERSSERGKNLLDEAHKLHQKATEVGKDSPRPWIALVAFLTRIGRPEDAEKEIQRANASLPDEIKAITIAHCYAVVGEHADAEANFKRALIEDPTNAGHLLAITRFYAARNQPDDAVEYLNKLLAKDSKATARQKAIARELQILFIASRGNYADLELALKQLDSPDRSRLSDLQTRAKILQSSTLKKDRLRLIDVLQKIDERKPLTTSNRYQLARLYEMTGKWQEAETTIRNLLDTYPDNRTYLSWYAGALLRNVEITKKSLNAVRDLSIRLKAADPKWVGTAAIEARILHAENKPVAAAQVMTNWATTFINKRKQLESDDAARLKIAVDFCEELKLYAAAEQILVQFAQLSKRPDNQLALATFYGRRAKYSEGLEICERSVKTCQPAAVAVSAVNVVALGNPSQADLTKADQLLQAALKAEPKSIRIQAAYATLLTSMGRLAEAEKLYRDLRTKVPKSVAIANNLAWLLAMRKQQQPDAVEFIDDAKLIIAEAIARTGPVAELLDTRAIVHLSADDAESALADIEAAINENDKSATSFLHRAQAQLALKDVEAATTSMKTAQELGLRLSALHPLEHTAAVAASQATGVNIPR